MFSHPLLIKLGRIRHHSLASIFIKTNQQCCTFGRDLFKEAELRVGKRRRWAPYLAGFEPRGSSEVCYNHCPTSHFNLNNCRESTSKWIKSNHNTALLKNTSWQCQTEAFQTPFFVLKCFVATAIADTTSRNHQRMWLFVLLIPMSAAPATSRVDHHSTALVVYPFTQGIRWWFSYWCVL